MIAELLGHAGDDAGTVDAENADAHFSVAAVEPNHAETKVWRSVLRPGLFVIAVQPVPDGLIGLEARGRVLSQFGSLSKVVRGGSRGHQSVLLSEWVQVNLSLASDMPCGGCEESDRTTAEICSNRRKTVWRGALPGLPDFQVDAAAC
jgi:hypothetical protein